MKKALIFSLFIFTNLFFAQGTLNDTIKKSKVIFDFSGGLSSRIGSVEKTNDFILNNKINASRNGYFIEASLLTQFAPNSNHYMGIKYNNFFDYINENKLSISFYGLSYMYSSKFKTKDNFNIDLSIGYIAYRDKQYFFDDYTVKGGNIGVRTSVSYLLYIAKGVYSGPKLGLQFGTVKDFTVEKNGNTTQNLNLKGASESVSNFDFGLVLRVSI
ncbi:hypothetical protein [Flavobacterium sp.]|jgi:hypothetical protein|uniref:hypothetical protein n=1 Tax=Flavobacterium sp. TaxID=239 RepID=UPI002A82B5EC|nr:hypothetical protein [Flavobacterium sp.]